MIDHLNLRLGQAGWLEIQDKTDGPSKVVDLWIYTDPVIWNYNILPWSYIINDVESDISSFKLKTGTNAWQHIGTVFVGYAPEFTFRSHDTGSGSLGHGQDITIQLALAASVRTVAVYDEASLTWKRATPFVNDGGIWKPANSFVMDSGEWKEAT